MQKQNLNLKHVILAGALGVFFMVGIITFLTSWVDVDPGYEGFIYRPYGSGVDTSQAYTEGTYFIAPWNEMITYETLQKSSEYNSEVMDKNGTDINIVVSVNYSPSKGQSAKLHLKHGVGFISFVNDKSLGSIKDVVGRYTYEEVFSTKREALENEIEEILKADFKNNYLTMHYAEIKDVNLPPEISEQINLKETQKQRNKTAELLEQQKEFEANAKRKEAKGDADAEIIRAKGKADANNLISRSLTQPLLKDKEIKKWDGKLPTYMVGDKSPFILK